MSVIRDLARVNYQKIHNDTLLGDRVYRDLVLENESGPDCALFQINFRCDVARRRERVFH